MDRVKNALYLLGDAEREAGDLDSAYEYFYRLQQRFYPDSPQLVDMMVAVGMRKMVNLRA
jgi:TolA-binding protein